MKTTYLVRMTEGPEAGSLRLATGEEWFDIVKRNKELPPDQQRYFITDNIVDNGTTKGLLDVKNGFLVMNNSTSATMLPVWVDNGEGRDGYEFHKVRVTSKLETITKDGEQDSFKFTFLPSLATSATDTVNRDLFSDGALNNGVSVLINVHCINKDSVVVQTLVFKVSEDMIIDTYTNNRRLVLTVGGADDSFESYEIEVVVTSNTGYSISYDGGVFKYVAGTTETTRNEQ
jgi:hypothetical protein